MDKSEDFFTDVSELKKLESNSNLGRDVESESEVNDRATMRYVDFRVLPILALTYAFSLIDRVNLGSAMVAGMAGDLQMLVGNRYSIVTVVYFIPYILLQIPGNAILRAVGVRYCMTFVIVVWGAVTIGMGFTKHWEAFAVCRVLISALEAVFFPGMVFIISTWYKRHEVQKRLAAFCLTSALIGGFSPLLAYSLSLMDGKANVAGWAWIFIMEGIITVVLGLLCYLFVPEFPDRNRFLSKAQTAFVLKRIEDDRGDSTPDEITARKVLHHCKDWRIWMYGVMFACPNLASYMFALFMPIILNGMNFSYEKSLLLTSPPYGFAFVSSMIISWTSDKTRHRGGFVVLSALMTTVGCCMTAFAQGNAVRYAGVCSVLFLKSDVQPVVFTYYRNIFHMRRVRWNYTRHPCLELQQRSNAQ
ncbi:hypothetical protein E1B28_002133 [Marasmius oreades]|uniref:Major facilitator superfamily (MFS) profile domain-containing protein n=1 Tax=Marasmius oreades TaxID=181124 RepID=A0A9P7RM39_9AGAR|nr:uncharacterized protein E1B28_002133 [Marasmius oreades]KAG7086174.1 hypothetical protein E1B28_002133 [Marasmius oreades]